MNKLQYDARAHSPVFGCLGNTLLTKNNKGVRDYAKKYKEDNLAEYNGILPLIEKFTRFVSRNDLQGNMTFVYYNHAKNYLAATNGFMLVVTHFEKKIFSEDKFFNALTLPCETFVKHPDCPSILQEYYQKQKEEVAYTLNFSDIVYMTEKEFLKEEDEDENFKTIHKNGKSVKKIIPPKKLAFLPKFLENFCFDADYIKAFEENFGEVCKVSYDANGGRYIVLDYGDNEWGGRIFGIIMPISLRR
jgi:hypothetical protein